MDQELAALEVASAPLMLTQTLEHWNLLQEPMVLVLLHSLGHLIQKDWPGDAVADHLSFLPRPQIALCRATPRVTQ